MAPRVQVGMLIAMVPGAGQRRLKGSECTTGRPQERARQFLALKLFEGPRTGRVRTRAVRECEPGTVRSSRQSIGSRGPPDFQGLQVEKASSIRRLWKPAPLTGESAAASSGASGRAPMMPGELANGP